VIGVLVVDRDAAVADVHRRFVDRVPGFGVSGVASTGAAALAAVESAQPGVVLLDLCLPDLPADEMLRRLATRPAPPEVLAVCGSADAAEICMALSRGALTYLIKPFSLQCLRVRLERLATTCAPLGRGSEPASARGPLGRAVKAFGRHQDEVSRAGPQRRSDLTREIGHDVRDEAVADQGTEVPRPGVHRRSAPGLDRTRVVGTAPRGEGEPAPLTQQLRHPFEVVEQVHHAHIDVYHRGEMAVREARPRRTADVHTATKAAADRVGGHSGRTGVKDAVVLRHGTESIQQQ
jgi:DNA-binding response OmpR family regulator